MTPPNCMLRSRAVRAMVLAVAMWGALLAVPAMAEPDLVRVRAAESRPEQSVPGIVGQSSASLEATSFAIPLGGPYSFTGRVATPEGTDSVQMRLKVYNPSGRLMTQRTRIINDPVAEETTASFERETADLRLSSGAYPVELEIRISAGGRVAETVIESDLLIYDPTAAPQPIAFTARISGQPLADPQGRFVADPGQFTRARDDAREIARWILEQNEARATVAISPVLLEEWKRVSEGYVFAGPEGLISVPASSTVPVAYAETLGMLQRAVGTGRLELAALGYTDPDLSELAAHDLGDDVAPQYAEGISAVFASLGSSPSTGSVPAGGCVPQAAVSAMAKQGVEYVVVSPGCTRSGSTTATTGHYRITGQELTALVSDDISSDAVRRGDEQALLRRTFALQLNGVKGPIIVTCDVGAGQSTVPAFIRTADVITSQRWVRVRLASEIAATAAGKTIAVRGRSASKNAPRGYWDEVAEGRAWATALTAALGQGANEAVIAQRDSLVAQCSAWAGVDDDWVLADRGRAFASTAVRISREALDPVDLRVEPVTLAGSRGDVPITITNGSDRELVVELSGSPSGGVGVLGQDSRKVKLPPQDTFVEMPVNLSNSLSGQLTVRVSSGGMVLVSQVVPIRASYLDRLVMIALVVIVLGALLFIIVRKARPGLEQNESDCESGGVDPQGSI